MGAVNKFIEGTKEKIYKTELRRMILKEWTRANLKVNDMHLLIGMAEHFGLGEFAQELKQSIDHLHSLKGPIVG